MNIDQLRQFCLIVETGTMAEASRLLHLSAGALSRSMQRLTEEVGFELFQPDGRKVVLTEQGRSLFALVNQTLFDLKSGLNKIRQKQAYRSPIRIASFEVFTTYVMSALIRKEFSSEEFLVLERTPGQIEKAIADDEADIGITYAPVVSTDLNFTKVASFKMGAFRQGRKFETMDLAEVPFAMPTTSLSVNLPELDSLDGWPNGAPERNIKYRFEMLETAVLACQNGSCAIFIPEFIAALANQRSATQFLLTPLPLPPKFERHKHDVYLVTRKSMKGGRTFRRLAQGLKELCAL